MIAIKVIIRVDKCKNRCLCISSLVIHVIEINGLYLLIAAVKGKKNFGHQNPERKFAAISNPKPVRLQGLITDILSCVWL